MDPFHRLEEIFARFPGIGPRQARRFVYHLLNKSAASVKEFTKLVEDVRKSASSCERCQRVFIGRDTDKAGVLCPICSDPSRDQSLLMIVARDSDYESIEKSGAYRGLYFVLGGTVPVFDEEPEKRIRLSALSKRIAKDTAIKEVIISLNATPEGEHTVNVVREALQESKGVNTLKMSVLGRGLSTGAELEYTDGDTIRSALKNRA